jgi:pyrroloquinoline-quinone synthase
VRNTTLLPETRDAISTYQRIARDEQPAAALAALYAYESQQPEVMRTKREGLADRYGVATGHDYFTVHESLDVQHSEAERALVLSEAGGAEEESIYAAVRNGLDATYTLLDGIHQRYVEAV